MAQQVLLDRAPAPRPFDRSDAVAELRPRLWNYLRSSAQPHEVGSYVEALWQLPAGQFERLVAVHAALQAETADMLTAVERLLPRLPRSLVRVREEYSGFVHGPVDWTLTARRRINTGDPTLFVCSPPERLWDSVPARMCHFALRRAARLGTLAGLDDAAGIGQTIAIRTDRARLVLRNPRLSSFRRERYPRREAVERAAARYPELFEIDRFVQMLIGLIDDPNADAVRAVLEERVLAPADASDIFELLVGYRIVDALRARGFGELRSPTLRTDDLRLPLSRLASAQLGRVDVWWDQSVWRVLGGSAVQASVLRRVLDAAKMSPAAFRPDLTLHFRDLRRIFVIEVKATGKLVARERDGIREALAYLKDGEALFAGHAEPHAMVVAWNATGAPWAEGATGAPVVVADQDHIAEGVDRLLSAASVVTKP